MLRCGFCVKQGNVVSTRLYYLKKIYVKEMGGKRGYGVVRLQRKSWKRRFFTLDDNAVSYYKSDTVRSQHHFHLLIISCDTLNMTVLCVCSCPRTRSLSEVFLSETFRRSMNVSSSQGESRKNQSYSVQSVCTFSKSAYLPDMHIHKHNCIFIW